MKINDIIIRHEQAAFAHIKEYLRDRDVVVMVQIRAELDPKRISSGGCTLLALLDRLVRAV